MRAFLTAICTAALVSSAPVVAMARPAGDHGPGEIPPAATAGAPVPAGELTLEQALSLALASSPLLVAQERAVSAADARVLQAGLLPNPEIDLETENFGGQGAFTGFDAAENTATVSQPILLGGKRKRRRAVARMDHSLAAKELAATRLDLIAATTASFYGVLISQEREALAQELLDLARRFARTVQLRVDAGKVSPVEGIRARTQLAQAEVRLARAKRELAAARSRLAANWGSKRPAFEQAKGEPPEPLAPPPLERLRCFLQRSPEMTRLRDLVKRQESIYKLERSSRIPDLRVSVGRRRLEEIGQSAWVAGISLPIPLFDRNQGSRRAARFEIERSRYAAEGSRIALESSLVVAFERLQATVEEVTRVAQRIVPSAREAFAAIETGYREGKFPFLDLLDAQRTLFDARSVLLESQQDYLLARTRVERLIGRALSPAADFAAEICDPDQGEQE